MTRTMRAGESVSRAYRAGSAIPSGTSTTSDPRGSRGSPGSAGRTPAARHTESNAGSDTAPRSSTSCPPAAMAAASSYIVRIPPPIDGASYGVAASSIQPGAPVGIQMTTTAGVSRPRGLRRPAAGERDQLSRRVIYRAARDAPDGEARLAPGSLLVRVLLAEAVELRTVHLQDHAALGEHQVSLLTADLHVHDRRLDPGIVQHL